MKSWEVDGVWRPKLCHSSRPTVTAAGAAAAAATLNTIYEKLHKH